MVKWAVENIQNDMGQRPVDLASGGGHVGVAQLLRLHEAALSLSSETLQANHQLHYLQADYAHIKSYFRFLSHFIGLFSRSNRVAPPHTAGLPKPCWFQSTLDHNYHNHVWPYELCIGFRTSGVGQSVMDPVAEPHSWAQVGKWRWIRMFWTETCWWSVNVWPRSATKWAGR